MRSFGPRHQGRKSERNYRAQKEKWLGPVRAQPPISPEWALARSTEVAQRAEGKCAPHPRYGIVLLDHLHERLLAEAHQHGEGGSRPEAIVATSVADGSARSGHAFLCLEPPAGGAAGGDDAVRPILRCGVLTCTIGVLNPVQQFRGRAAQLLRSKGVRVSIAEHEWDWCKGSSVWQCRKVNEAVLHREALSMPMSVHKFAMTLDGKIAAKTGHSAWVSGTEARERVQLERERSDAIIVGGQTLRSDNPRLTARRELEGHAPLRIVLTRSLNVPENANLWDTSTARTMVVTERGANKAMQRHLSLQGVEVLELDFVSPRALVEYCRQRGFMQLLWECGGTLSAQAIRDGVLHHSQAFIAAKIVGGASECPSPVGDLGFVEMTQALQLAEVQWNPIGDDMLVSGYLPASGGLARVAQKLEHQRAERPPRGELHFYKVRLGSAPSSIEASLSENRFCHTFSSQAWHAYGALSNFSAHPVVLEDGSSWPTSEHLYQSLKFDWSDSAGLESKTMIQNALSPDVAARIGRTREGQKETGFKSRWNELKVDAMRYVLDLKFAQNSGPRRLLLATGVLEIKEVCPHDYVWGVGDDGSGLNLLGKLLMELRSKLRSAAKPEKSFTEEERSPHSSTRDDHTQS